MNLSWFDRCSVIFDLLVSSPLLIFSFLLLCGLCTFLFLNLYQKKKIYRYFLIGLTVGFVLFLVACYMKPLFTTLDFIIDDLFLKVYFPSVTFCFFILMTSIVTTLVTIVTDKFGTWQRNLNIVFFLFFQLFFCLFLSVLETNAIDLTSWSDLYQKKEVLSILESTTLLFVLWIFLSMVFYILNKIKKESKEEIVEEVKENIILEEPTELDLLKEKVEQLNQALLKQQELQKEIEQTDWKEKYEYLESMWNRKDQYYMEQINLLKQSDTHISIDQFKQQVENYIKENIEKTNAKLDALERKSTETIPEMTEKLVALNELLTIFQSELEQVQEESEIEIIDFDEEG